MKKTFTQIFRSLAVGVALFGLVATPSLMVTPSVLAAANTNEVQEGIDKVGGTDAGNTAGDLTALISSIIDILLFIIGAVSVIMIIIGGIRYTTSNGDAAQTKAAQNTILYSVAGLVVAIMAFAIVNFVVDQL